MTASFQYEVYKQGSQHDTLLTIPLGALECKHVVPTASNHILDLSRKVGYEWVVFGSHRDGSLKSEDAIIRTMALDPSFNRPIRIVRTSDGRLWADNTHSTMAYMTRYGLDTILGEVPFYLVDFTETVPLVLSVSGSVHCNTSNIMEAVSCAKDVDNRVISGVRPSGVSWTVLDLYRVFYGLCRQYGFDSLENRNLFSVPISELM